MFTTLPSLNGLRAFEAVARLGSFSAAADELHVTHGAVSRLVKALEGQVGVTLLSRGRSGAKTTGSGAQLYQRLRPALDLMRAGVDEISQPPPRGTLILSCYGTFLMRWLMPRFHRFTQQNPDVEISFTTHNHLADFSGGGIDLAISTALPEQQEGFRFDVLFDEVCGPVCRPGLIEGERADASAQLNTAALLHTETRPSAWQDWLQSAAFPDVDSGRGDRYAHFYFMLQAAASGLGIGIGPHALVADDLASGQLVAPFGFRPSGRYYYLSYRDSALNDPRVVALQDWLMAEARDFSTAVQLETP